MSPLWQNLAGAQDKTRSHSFAFLPPPTPSIPLSLPPSPPITHLALAITIIMLSGIAGRWRALQRSRVLHSEARALKRKAVRLYLAWSFLWLLHHNRTSLRFVAIIAGVLASPQPQATEWARISRDRRIAIVCESISAPTARAATTTQRSINAKGPWEKDNVIDGYRCIILSKTWGVLA